MADFMVVRLAKAVDDKGQVTRLTEEELVKLLHEATADVEVTCAVETAVAEEFDLHAFYGGGKATAEVPVMVLFFK